VRSGDARQRGSTFDRELGPARRQATDRTDVEARSGGPAVRMDGGIRSSSAHLTIRWWIG
jgi:hypothetical protein